MSKTINIYKKLLKHFGRQHWWPAETRFEVIVGAILTQNTSWKNVEKAIKNLKKEKMLNCKKIANINIRKLEKMIQPSGFYKQKAERLKRFCKYLDESYDSDLNKFFDRNTDIVRNELLSLNGIGNETADSILLYAGEKLKFVVDAYTVRMCERTGIINAKKYDELQSFFEKNLPKNIEMYKEFHALIVELGKNFCRKKPGCDGCPLKNTCKIRV
ncbi:MAG: endonuclease III domain-containing protein [Candidatus Thermoplasmatota archaeon]|nr:endonuclease III domain-containing protein [Candidatus Thermoplasmatota archaeon]